MRKFRNAAVAGMTAVTLVAGLNTTAFADDVTSDATPQSEIVKDGKPASERDSSLLRKDETCDQRDRDMIRDGEKLLDFDKVRLGDRNCVTRAFEKDLKDYVKKPTNSSVWGKRYDATHDAYGVDLLGQDKNFDAQPVWSQIWFVATILGVIGTVVGIGYLPVMNQLKAMGFII